MWPNIQPAQLTHQLGVKAQAISIGFNEFGYRQWLEQWVKYLMLSFVWYDSIMDSNQLNVSVFLLGRYPCFYINNFNQFNRIEIWFYWLIILVLISHDWFRDGFKPIESEFGFIGSLSLLCHQLSAMWWQFVRGVKVARDMLLMHGHALQRENEPLIIFFNSYPDIVWLKSWKVEKNRWNLDCWTNVSSLDGASRSDHNQSLHNGR